MKYKFIKELSLNFPIENILKALNVGKSSYYQWLKTPYSERDLENINLLAQINEIHLDSKLRYGSPRIHKELKVLNQKIGKNRVAKLMSENKIAALFKKKFRLTTDSNHDYKISPNLLNRNFVSNKPDKKWVSDMTYIKTDEGWVYLCTIIDLFSRKIVGWSMSENIDTALLIDSFLMAVINRKPQKGLIFHSDRGVQYASNEFRNILGLYDIKQSMSRKGNCWDNAVAESFFKTIKTEEIYRWNFKTRAEAKSKIFEYIETFYNIKRRHSSIEYLSPNEYELLNS